MENKFKMFVDFRSTHKLLTSPLTIDELKKVKTKDGRIKVKLTIDLYDLIGNDMEWLNDEISERITSSSCGLTDINYKVGGRTTSNEVILSVDANVDDILAEADSE